MKNVLKVVMLFLLLLLMGCSVKKNQSEQEVKNTEENKTTVLVADKEVINTTEEQGWGKVQYIDDILYYAVSSREQETDISKTKLYAKEEGGNATILLERDGMWNTSIAVGKNIHCLVAREKNCYYTIFSLDGMELLNSAISDEAVEVLIEEGCVASAVHGGNYCIMTVAGTFLCFNSQGEETGRFSEDWQKEVLEYNGACNYGLLNGQQGIYAYFYKEDSILLQQINAETGEVVEESVVENTLKESKDFTELQLYSGYDEGIYIADRDVLYVYEDEKGELRELIDWSKSTVKVDFTKVSAIRQDADKGVVFAGYDWETKQGMLTSVEQREVESSEVQTIEVGYIQTVDYNVVKECVDAFNLEHENIQVICKAYEDKTALHLELIRGEGPDILDLTGLDVDEYAQKEVLENLSPYFDVSENLDEEDILPALRESMIRNGGIRFVFPSFIMKAIIMDKDFVTSKSMTTKEFLSIVNEKEDGYLCYLNAGTFLMYILPLEQEKYIDWENRICNFCDGEFVTFLDKLKEADFPQNVKGASYDAESLLENECLSMFHVMVSCTRSIVEIKDAFGDEICIVGYPNSMGEEIYPIYPAGGWLGMNSASKQKEAAWEFLEYYLLNYAQTKNQYGAVFSVLTETFEQQLYLEPVTYRLTTNIYTGEDMEKESFMLEEEDRELIRHMVERAECSNLMQHGIVGDIIMEEVRYYLKGEKTAQEVAEIIQNRVSLYMAE